MTALLIDILNMSLTASFVALAVILARFALKRAPKVFSYALWALVLFRLVCPVSFESPVSALPIRAQIIPQDIVYAQTPLQISAAIAGGTALADGALADGTAHTNAALTDGTRAGSSGLTDSLIAESPTQVNNALNASLNASLPATNPTASVNPIQIWLELGAYVWLIGACAMLAYAIISYLRLKARLRDATLVSGNLFETDRIDSPFVLGFIRPKIYAPAGEPLPEHILLHEQAHIRRRDYLIKPVAFLALALHWFNPLVWLCYFLMTRDMELSADEAALKAMGSEPDSRRGYCESLLNMATKRRALVPLAFGESGGGVKARVKNALSFKKPAVWVTAVAAIVVIALCVILVPNRAEPQVQDAPYDIPPGTFMLNGDRVQPDWASFHSMTSLDIREDGTAVFNLPPISSYLPPPCSYAVEDGELVFRAKPEYELEEEFYGVKTGGEFARFAIHDGGKSLEFLSSQVPIFTDPGMRYMHESIIGASAADNPAPPAQAPGATDAPPPQTQDNAAPPPAPDSYDLIALLANKTPYVGDNAKVSKLVSLLPVPDEDLIQKYISIGDEYGTSYGGVDPDGKTLTIYYEVKDTSVDAKELRDLVVEAPDSIYWEIGQWNALVLFSTIENLEEIAYRVRFTPSNGELDMGAYSDSWYTHRAFYEDYCDMENVYENDDDMALMHGIFAIDQGTVRMTPEDVRNLAQKGAALVVGDFLGFYGTNVGSGFFIMQFDVEGGTLEVHADTTEPDAKPNYARFTKAGLDPMDQANMVDLLQGPEALEAYLSEDS